MTSGRIICTILGLIFILGAIVYNLPPTNVGNPATSDAPEDRLHDHCNYVWYKTQDKPIGELTMGDLREVDLCKASGNWR